MHFGDGARRCIILSNVTVGMVVVTQGEPAWALAAVVDGLDLVVGTSASMR
jgi:hypothetical protein